MGDLGLDTAGRATGISSSLDDIFLQKLQEARFNEVQRQAQAEMDMRRQQMDQQAQAQQFNEKIRQDTLAENARQHSAAESDKAGQLADKRFALTPIGGLVPMADYQKMQGAGIPSQLFKPQPLTAAAPPASIATGGPETLPGTFANSVEPDAQNHLRQATQPEIEQQAKDDAAAAKEADATRFRDAQAAETKRNHLATESAAAAAAGKKDEPANIDADVQTTGSGRKYIDLSIYQGASRTKAQQAAQAAGISTVSKEQAEALQEIDNARMNQQDILNQVQGILKTGAGSRLASIPTTRLEQLFQTDEQKSAYSSWRTAAIQTLRATAGSKGLRINKAEIEQAVQNDIPLITDTLGTAQQKFKNINKMLNNAETSIVVHDRSQPASQGSDTGIPEGVTITRKP